MTRWLQAAKRTTDAGTEPTQLTKPRPEPVLSVLSVLSEGKRTEARAHVANVASVATPSAPRTEPDGATVGGRAATWTGKVVSLDDWRHLTAWEKHGPDGRHWCGLSKAWKGEQR